jgi:hypothetical protein
MIPDSFWDPACPRCGTPHPPAEDPSAADPWALMDWDESHDCRPAAVAA